MSAAACLECGKTVGERVNLVRCVMGARFLIGAYGSPVDCRLYYLLDTGARCRGSQGGYLCTDCTLTLEAERSRTLYLGEVGILAFDSRSLSEVILQYLVHYGNPVAARCLRKRHQEAKAEAAEPGSAAEWWMRTVAWMGAVECPNPGITAEDRAALASGDLLWEAPESLRRPSEETLREEAEEAARAAAAAAAEEAAYATDPDAEIVYRPTWAEIAARLPRRW